MNTSASRFVSRHEYVAWARRSSAYMTKIVGTTITCLVDPPLVDPFVVDLVFAESSTHSVGALFLGPAVEIAAIEASEFSSESC